MGTKRKSGCGLWLAFAWLAAVVASPATAQQVDLPLFAGGTVREVLATADGGILTLGDYQFVDATPVDPLVRLRPDSSIDPAWSHQIFGTSLRLLRDPADGSILVFGQLLSVNGEPRSGIARFAHDGTLLPWQAGFPGIADSPTILRAGVLPGGALIVLAQGSDLQVQQLFRIEAGGGPAAPLWVVEGSVAELIALPDGSVVLAGSVSRVGDVVVSGAARLSGHDLLPSNLFDAPPVPITSLDRDPNDGRWYVASGNNVVRFQSTGERDPAWSAGADGLIERVKVDGESGVLVAGAFSRILGAERSRIARLRKDVSAVDATWVPPAIRGRARAIALDSDRVVVGGSLVSAEAGQVGLVVLARTGGAPVPPSQRRRFGIAGDTSQQRGHRAIALPDGGVIVTGPFTHTTDAVLPGILRLDSNGALRRDWVPLIGGLVSQLALSGDGHLYLSGTLARGGEFAEDSMIRVNLASGALEPGFRLPARADSDYGFALDGGFVYAIVGPNGGWWDREVRRWLPVVPPLLDPGWRAPAGVLANIRGLQAPRADGSLRFAVWVRWGAIDFNPPPPRPPAAIMRSTAFGAAAAADFGSRFDAYSAVERVHVDPLGRTYLSGRIQLEGQSDLVFPRLMDDGALDPSFRFRSPNVWANGAIRLGPSGEWLYASMRERAPDGSELPFIARLDTRTGAIDLDWAPNLVAGWPVADIAMAGERVFVVADGWPTTTGLPMLRAAFLDPGAGALMRDGFEPSPPAR